MEFPEGADEPPSLPPNLNSELDFRTVETSELSPRPQASNFQLGSGVPYIPHLPDQTPLPHSFNPARVADPGFGAGGMMGHQQGQNVQEGHPASHSLGNSFSLPYTSGGLLVPGQQASIARRLTPRQRGSRRRRHRHPRVFLNVARSGHRGQDNFVCVDLKSNTSYMSRGKAAKIGLQVLEYVYAPLLKTSAGTFTPTSYAANVNIWSFAQGLTDTDATWNIAITPDNWGEVPLTLGKSAIARLEKMSVTFQATLREVIDQHQQSRRELQSNPSSLASSSQWAANLSAGQFGTTLPSSLSTPFSGPRQQALASSSADMSAYTQPTPLTPGSANRPSNSMFAHGYMPTASGSGMHDHQQCLPLNFPLLGSFAAENPTQPTNTTQPTVALGIPNAQETPASFQYNTPFPMDSELGHSQQSFTFPQQPSGSRN